MCACGVSRPFLTSLKILFIPVFPTFRFQAHCSTKTSLETALWAASLGLEVLFTAMTQFFSKISVCPFVCLSVRVYAYTYYYRPDTTHSMILRIRERTYAKRKMCVIEIRTTDADRPPDSKKGSFCS